MAHASLKRKIIHTFTTPREPASFTSPSKLIRDRFKRMKLEQIQASLKDIDAYTKHKPYKRKFPRLKTQTGGIDKQWQLDLIDMQSFARYNKGFKHILVGIDVFSRYGFAQPVKSKRGKDILEAFQTMTSERSPQYVQTDKGKEFLNTTFQDYLKKKNISFFVSENDDIKCSIAERFNGTLQGKLWKYFTHNNTYRYIDVLPDLVYSYNHTTHKTLSIPPALVNEDIESNLFYKLYDSPSKHKPSSSFRRTVLKKGDKVRILKRKKTFNRGYEPNWSEEIFTVDQILRDGLRVKDLTGERIKGRFYPEEVQKISVSRRKKFSIEKILKVRGQGKNKQALVKWKGYSDKFNTWEPMKNIEPSK